jgi:hypothetical protein
MLGMKLLNTLFVPKTQAKVVPKEPDPWQCFEVPKPIYISEPVLSIIRTMDENPESWIMVGDKLSRTITVAHSSLRHLELHFCSGYVSGDRFSMYGACWMTKDEREAVIQAFERWLDNGAERERAATRKKFMALTEHYGQTEFQFN